MTRRNHNPPFLTLDLEPRPRPIRESLDLYRYETHGLTYRYKTMECYYTR
jgi:hypothetical protein